MPSLQEKHLCGAVASGWGVGHEFSSVLPRLVYSADSTGSVDDSRCGGRSRSFFLAHFLHARVSCRASSASCCACSTFFRSCSLLPSIINLTSTTATSIERVPTATVPKMAPNVSDANVIADPLGQSAAYALYRTHPVVDTISHLADNNRVASAPISSQSACTPEMCAKISPARFRKLGIT